MCVADSEESHATAQQLSSVFVPPVLITCYSTMLCTGFFFAAVTGIAYLGQVQADHHLVNGAPLPPDGSIPLRRNVDVLEAESGPQWDLYIQALLEMQKVDSKDPLSYFQIAGSHFLSERSCLEVFDVLTKVVPGRYSRFAVS